MSRILFWKGVDRLDVIVEPDSAPFPNEFVKAAKSDDTTVFLLDDDSRLWEARAPRDTKLLYLRKTCVEATDFTVSGGYLYATNDLGRVYKYSPGLDTCEELVLHEEASSCIHGYTTSSHRVAVKRVCGGGMGVLFLSDRGELWALGDHPQLEIRPEDGPKKVSFFEGRHVTLMGCGTDFNLVVAHKRDDTCPVNTADMGNGETEVFLSSCPHCNAVSPLSPQSYSDTCPLGLQLKKSNESLSASTSTSKNNEDSLHKKSDNGNSSSSTEADSYRVPESKTVKNEEPAANAEGSTAANEKGDKVTMLLINTEAARQFLTRQLSWMSSGGEELLAEVTAPTNFIKQNVSNMASLVYEGVKTVGDKVATLSRHMSGGSDNNSESFEEFEELNRSNASCAGSFRLDWSCSEGSEEAAAERSGALLSRGARIIRAEVWTWGSSQYGQLGLGDTVRRHKPVLVGGVSHVGVVWVSCGRRHCVVSCLDGRWACWGSNREGQVSYDRWPVDQSAPIWQLSRAKAVAATESRTVYLTNDTTSLVWSTPVPQGSERKELVEKEGLNGKRLLAAGDITCCVVTCGASSYPGLSVAATADLAHEQCYLEELLSVHSSIVKPLSRKSCLDDTLCALCARYTDLLHITAGVASLLVEGRSVSSVLSDNVDELVFIYEYYLNAVCDVISTNGFAHISRSVETPSKLTACFSDRLPTGKTSSESVLSCAFIQPLTHIAVYKGMVSRGGGNGLSRWENLLEAQEIKRKEAELTKVFWESAGRLVDLFRTPSRRLVRESKSNPLTLHNASRFSSHWFILLSDAFVHVTGATHQIHSLDTLWIDSALDTDSLQNALIVTTPEESLTLIAGNANEKTEWLHAFQSSIKAHLSKSSVLAARSASYTFTKHPVYKEGKYTGRWMTGKLEGLGRLEWADGKVYCGQFHNGLCHGSGRLEIPGVSIYEGQWRDGLQNGLGTTRYENGDTYSGYYKDGHENGHGVRKTGRFTSSQASVYVGEWLSGLKNGYGVMINIGTGEKYLGLWSNNMKNGSGLIVTLDGIYYEGNFVQDVLTGHGVMMFDDGTHYEGELREAGVFSGKGTLTFSSGDTFEGTLHGAWNDGVKISGILHKHLPTSSPRHSVSKPSSFGQLCVSADQKWKGILKQCWVSLGATGEGKGGETQKAWENIAVAISTSANSSRARHHDLLHTIPEHSRPDMDPEYYHQIVAYLTQAFESIHHPLGRTLYELVEAYTTTYGGVLVHPLLLSQAVAELHSITFRLYQVVRLLFPALPHYSAPVCNSPTTTCSLSNNENDTVSMTGLLHPMILPKLYSSLLVLYSLHNKNEDETYWKRLLKWNRHPDSTLMAFLGIDRKFWAADDGSLKKECLFGTAVETLQQLKTTFSPMEKLIVIQNTFQEMTKAVQSEVGDDFVWTMDDLFPVFQYVVVRARMHELGSEIHFVDDFMEPRLKNGELGIMFTTLKACFYQILQEKISISN